MSSETQDPQEESAQPRKGSLFGDIAIVTVALGVNFVMLSPFLVVHRTAGASTTEYRDGGGRPLLLELRHCRVVPPTASDPGSRTPR